MPRLSVTLPDGTEVTHELTEDVVTIGRVSDNTIQIDDISVSSHHAELVLRDEDYAVKDTGSTNGTTLNGKALQPDHELQLQNDDRLRFGSIDVAYLSETPADARPMPAETEAAAVAAEASIRPTDFANASPFQTKKKKKDPVGLALMAFSVVAILVFGAAVAAVFGMKSPL